MRLVIPDRHGGAPTEHNGYAASSIGSRHGLDSLMVPTCESGGGGRFSGGGRFRGGDGEEQGDYWGNHFRSRCEPSSGLSAGGAVAASPAMKQFGVSMTRRAMSTYSSYRQRSPGVSLNTIRHSNQYFDGYSNQYAGQPSSRYLNRQSNQFADPYTNIRTALRRAVGERPMNGLSNYGNRF